METETFQCPYCKEPVATSWVENGGGMLHEPDKNVLVGDWVFHPQCWDKMLEENPPFRAGVST